MNFEAFINDINNNNWNVHGVEVYERGKLLHSWGNTQTKFPIYSATKSILSLAMGIAWDRGLVDFSKSVLEYMPKEAVEKMSVKQVAKFKQISLHRLMTMSVKGFPFRPSGSAWLEQALSCNIPDPKTAAFEYSNIPALLTGVALCQITGQAGEQFILKELLTPLGIENAKLGLTPEGYFYGASNMELSVNDLSRFGLLLYNNGSYNGTQIVSSQYVKLATSVLQENREEGYGYFFWKYKDGFSINGKWKQKCYVIPSKELIITFLSDIQDKNCTLRESMETYLL